MSKFIRLMIITIIIPSLTTGCWDRVEMESRAFIVAQGVDIYEPPKSDKRKGPILPKTEHNKYVYTYMMPKFSTIAGAEGSDSDIVFKTVARTSYKGTRQLDARTDSQMFYEHLKAVIFGKDVVKDPDGLLEHLDALERQDQITRKLNLYIAEDRAEDILSTEIEMKPLYKVLQNIPFKSQHTSTYIPTTLEEAISAIAEGAAIIPKISSSKNDIKVAGCAVIKKDKFIGWLGEKETKVISHMLNKTKTSIIDTEYKGVPIPYIVSKSYAKKKARIEDGKIKIDISITTQGKIAQYSMNARPRLDDLELLKDMERLIERRIKSNCEKTINKLQNELNADVIGIGDYLENHEPEVWKEVKGNWDEVFPQVEINVEVHSSITKIGTIK